jgi:hypothetical protein
MGNAPLFTYPGRRLRMDPQFPSGLDMIGTKGVIDMPTHRQH